MGVDAMIEGLELVRAGVKLQGIRRTSPTAPTKAGSRRSWPSSIGRSRPPTVYNVIRAANPAPGAWSTIKGQKVDIFDSAKVAATGKPGEIVAIDANGMTIAAGGGAILAKRVRGADGKKIAAGGMGQSRRPQSRRRVRQARTEIQHRRNVQASA